MSDPQERARVRATLIHTVGDFMEAAAEALTNRDPWLLNELTTIAEACETSQARTSRLCLLSAIVGAIETIEEMME